MPHRILITDDLPKNANGKLDLYRINQGEVSGETFEVKPVRRMGRICDFIIKPLKEDESADMIREVFDGIAGTISAEPLFAFYGLNMTGACVSMLSYPDFLPGGQWKNMVKKEKLTDLIISDIMVTPEILRDLKVDKSLGLRHVILIHSRVGGPTCGPAELLYVELNYQWLKRYSGMKFMEDMLKRYGDGEIICSKRDAQQIAIITHTSGTTKGTRKPLPYTNQAINSVATGAGNSFHGKSRTYRPDDQLRIAPCFDFSSFLSINGFVNSHLAKTDTVVLTFFGFMHPKYVKAIDYPFSSCRT